MTQTLVILVVIVALVGWRIYRQTREQRWSVTTMWIAPAILVVIAGLVVAIDARSTPLVIAGTIAGLVVGAGIGLYQGTHTTVRVDKPNHALYVKISPIGLLIFFGVLVLRIGLRYAMGAMPAVSSGAAGPVIPTLTPPAAIAGSSLLALAVGMIVGLRIYMQRQYNSVLTE